MARFGEGMVDLDGSVVAADGGIEGEDMRGVQVEPGGYGSVWVNPLLLVLVVVGARCGAKEFSTIADGLGHFLCGGQDGLGHICVCYSKEYDNIMYHLSM